MAMEIFHSGLVQVSDNFYFIWFKSQEFVLATNLTTAASAEEKLKWAFKLYDKDESGDS